MHHVTEIPMKYQPRVERLLEQKELIDQAVMAQVEAIESLKARKSSGENVADLMREQVVSATEIHEQQQNVNRALARVREQITREQQEIRDCRRDAARACSPSFGDLMSHSIRQQHRS